MSPRLLLTPVQKSILLGLSANMAFDEIARGLHLTTRDVENKVKSIFCLVAFTNANRSLLKSKKSGERLN